ncbi:hypothetical protein [Kineobactrum salinum]|uniref:DUF1640 domain-containing protein n=1 Tax=Kineobactrum salinum TaxID=2708301 RepID=A0A6C0U1H9_9GAMM|nr:hypothetical protein [Kineobactrum salinum]QIB65982.1 hypothetical protein G3T16_11680 [Kineobactrum salinum]
MPEHQAEVQAELMAEAFGFYADNLLTRDHFTEVFNARLGEIGVLMDHRFTRLDARFEERCSGIETHFDKRFSDVETRFDQRCSQMESGFERRFARFDRTLYLHTWMLGVVLAVMTLPQMQGWWG